MSTTPDWAAPGFWSRHLAELGHELRSPLHAIMGLADLLADESRGPLNVEQQAVLTDIRIAARHLLHVVNSVLDISRLRHGQFDLELEVLSLAAVVDQALHVARGLAYDKHIGLEAQVPRDLAVRADERRVLQILHNLLANAIHYSPAETVVRVMTNCDDTVVWTLVQDQGNGIAPADQARIFDPFVTIKCGGEERGVGLGLAVCRYMVEAMGGAIEVSSAPGEGSCFRFSLPRTEAPV